MRHGGHESRGYASSRNIIEDMITLQRPHEEISVYNT